MVRFTQLVIVTAIMNKAKRVILELKDKFDLLIDESSSWKNYFTVRSSIRSVEEVDLFVKEFGIRTNTSYINKHCIQNPKRVICSKAWICQHTSQKKSKNSRRNANCKAGIHVLIKKINYFTIRNDKFLGGEFPLPCKIKINPVHSHSTDAMESLRMLRVPKEVNDVFFQYFDDGLTASQAKHVHETKILEEGGEVVDLANSIKNPTDRHVSYLYDIWRRKNGVNSLAQLIEIETPLGKIRLPSKRTYFRRDRYWYPGKNKYSSSWKDSFKNEDSNEESSFDVEYEDSAGTDAVAPDSTTNETDCNYAISNDFTLEAAPVPEKVTCSPIVVKLPCNAIQVSVTQEVHPLKGEHVHPVKEKHVYPVKDELMHDSQASQNDTMTKAEETRLFLKRKHDEDQYDIYGQHIATEIRAIPDDNQRKILKAKLKTLIFKAHHGLLTMNDVTNNSDL